MRLHPRTDSLKSKFGLYPNRIASATVCAVLHRDRQSSRAFGRLHHTSHCLVVQQARHLAWKIQDGDLHPRFLLCDRDTKFTTGLDDVFQSEGVKIVRIPFRSPRANSFAARWVGTARREALDTC
ncbi:MAG TPA: hypothetical protein VIR57_18140 [Chloroflexota bacterium]